MTTITRDLLKSLRPEIQAALTQIGKAHGLTIELGNATFNPTSATFKLLMVAPTDSTAPGDSAQVQKAAADFKTYAATYGLKADDLGRSFTHGGSSFVIKGLMPRRAKFPILCEKSSGKLILLNDRDVVRALKG